MTEKSKYLTRWSQLKSERASWLAHWRELSENLLPRSGRFFVQDRNRGNRRHNSIYDSTGPRALRTLSAGLMSGMTSPARPWFKLETADAEMMKLQPVKVWLNEVTELLHTIFQRSNTYRALHQIYEELGVYGTAACLIVPDFENVIHCYPLTCGEYAIATNWKGEVVTLYREFQKTVSEVVKEFGYNNCSPATQGLYDRGTLDAWVTIVHAIEPRTDRDNTMVDAKNMAWSSVYFEQGQTDKEYLRESGFKRFPGVAPRWAVSGGDIYGNSPGMEVLGDVKQLQHQQLRKAQAIDYQTNPPLQVPSSMKNRDVEILPGGISYVDAASPQGGIRTMFDVNLNLSYLTQDIQDVRRRIESGFYADLFLMLSNDSNPNMTATEVAERHEEKMLMLGPVLERLQNELLDPLIEIAFDAAIAAGIVPPPPQEIQGRDINVALVSILAQAQRAIATNSIDRFIGTVGSVAQYKPEVLDNVDGDKLINVYADSLGVDPNLILGEDAVAALRQQRAQQQQAAQQSALLNQGADTAQKLASAKTNEPNALSDIMSNLTGYTAGA